MRKLAFAFVAVFLAGVGSLAPAAAPAAFAATNPKVAIIVGATGSVTASYRADADQVYAEAIKYTSNVVKVYSPNATWTKVKAAVNGASIIVYLGHGNGWPSPYTYDAKFTTKDGFGLNYDTNGDGKLTDSELKYYGEPSIATLTPAPNAVVLLFHLCYASGNSEPGNTPPTLTVARQRVDNYASAFLKAGARAVIANGHSHDPYYIRALFTTHETIEQYWRNAPDYHNHVLTYASTRSPGYTYLMDPESSAPSSFYRSLTGKLSLTTTDVTGASYATTSGDPSTFVVPGNASPTTDGAPVYATAADAAAGQNPTTTLLKTDKVRIEGAKVATTSAGSSVLPIHTDGGVEGFMTAATLVPRDSAAPRLWTVTDGTGAFSPNGDGSQDTLPVSLRISEAATWTLSIRDGDGKSLATASDTSDTPEITWAPKMGAVADGTYHWTLTATDAWGNGPLATSGDLVVDTKAPNLSVGDPSGSVPLFTPNGDGSIDTISFTVGATEPGTITGTVRNAASTTVDSIATSIGSGAGTLTWDGRSTSGAYVADGRYDISIAARDIAGNTSAPLVRPVDAYGALGFIKLTPVLFYPQDGDTLAKATTLSFVLARPATVDWIVTDAAGTPVRTLRTAAALGAGTWTTTWDGRNDAGAFVPRGFYREVVTASNGAGLSATRATSMNLNAFAISPSDSTPARKQKITVTATSAEPLKAAPHLGIWQPGVTAWAVVMTKVSTNVYRATVTLKSGSTGTLTLKVYGYDTAGSGQNTRITLPLH